MGKERFIFYSAGCYRLFPPLKTTSVSDVVVVDVVVNVVVGVVGSQGVRGQCCQILAKDRPPSGGIETGSAVCEAEGRATPQLSQSILCVGFL